MRQIMIDDQGGVGTGGGSGGGSPSLLIPKYLDVNWTHTDATPWAQKGFRLVFYTGADPNDSSKYLVLPIELGPSERRYVQKVTVPSSTTVMAAIQATYLNGNESSWRVLGGSVVVDPDTVVVGTQAGVDAAAAAAATAQTTANNAASAAAAAQTAANNAQASANTANTALANIASDNILSPSEKPAAVLDYTNITNEQAGIDAQADAYGVSRTSYDAAVSALTSYLGTLPGWNVIPGSDVAITGTTFRQKFADVYSTRQALLNAIYAKAKSLADAAQSGVIVPNPNFDQDMGSTWPNMTQIAAGAAPAGCPTPFCGRAQSRDQIATPRFPVTPGAQIYYEAWIDTTQTTNTASFGLYFRDAAGNLFSPTYTASAPAGSAWAKRSSTLTVPAGAVSAHCFCQIDAVSSFGSAYFTGLRVSEGIPAQTAAAAAQTAANNAQASANTANTALANIASDNILSPSEKPAAVLDYTNITNEQAGIDAQADAYSVSRTSYDAAVSALTSYLGTLPGWNDIPGSDVAITGTTFRQKFADVYSTRQALLNAIYAKAKSIADAANDLAGSTIKPILFKDFSGGLPYGVTFPGTVASSDNGTTTTITNTANDQNLRFTGLNLDPAKSYAIAMRVKLITGPWEGTIYPSNAGHGENGLYREAIPAPPVGVWTTIVVDMRTLSVGGSDYMTGGNVLGLRFDFINDSGASVAIDWISVGAFGAVSQSDVDAAQSGVNTINDPDTLAVGEKPQIILDYNAVTGENADLVAKANAYGVSHATYDTAYSALLSYLSTLTSPTAWNSLSGTTALGAGNRVALWNPKWAAVKNAAADLRNAIAVGTAQNAISAAATDATNKANAVAITVPATVTGFPTLPDSVTYPSGKLIYETGTKRLYRSTGSTWEAATADAGSLTGTLDAARVAVGSLDSKISIISDSQISSLNGSKIAADSITAAQIAANAITSNELAAGSVFANHLTVANFDNLIPNGNSEMDLTGMPPDSVEGVGVATGYPYSGTRTRRITTTGTGWNWLYVSPFIPVSQDDAFYFEAMTGCDSPATRQIAIDVFDVSRNWVTGFYSGSRASDGDLSGSASTVYKKQTVQGVIPPGACFIRALVGAQNTSGDACNAQFDSLYMRRMADANLIVDGAITTQKIAASTITGDKIAASTITGDKITAGTITAGQIAAAAIGTNELAAGSVVASKMAMVAASLIPDACFEGGSANWRGHTGVVIPGSALSGCPGLYAGQFNARDCTSITHIPVYPGEKYFCSLTGYAYGGGGGAGFGIVVYGYDRSGSVVEAYCLANTSNTSSWVTLNGTITVGPNTVALAVGPWMDIPYGWVSANGGPLFTNMVLRKMADASLIVDGTLQALVTKTPLLYSLDMRSGSDENGYQKGTASSAPVGFRISANGFPSTLLGGETFTAQMELGAGINLAGYKLSGLIARSMSAIGDNGQTGTSFRCFYRGNNDPGTNGSRPNISRLTVTPTLYQTASPYTGRLDLKLAPSSYMDNLDGLSYAKIELFTQSAAGTSATLTTKGVYYCPLPDRIYYNPTSDSDAGNAAYATQVIAETGLSGVPACKVTLYGVAGSSDTHCFYAASGWAAGTALTDNGTAWPSGMSGASSGGTGGGTGGGGACPAPDVPLLMADGTEKPAGVIRVGDRVVAWDEAAGCECVEEVTHAVMSTNHRWLLVLSNGRTGRFAANHRFLLGDGRWQELQHLVPGDVLTNGLVVESARPDVYGPVVKITVNRVHTYITLGVVSHNVKIPPT